MRARNTLALLGAVLALSAFGPTSGASPPREPQDVTISTAPVVAQVVSNEMLSYRSAAPVATLPAVIVTRPQLPPGVVTMGESYFSSSSGALGGFDLLSTNRLPALGTDAGMNLDEPINPSGAPEVAQPLSTKGLLIGASGAHSTRSDAGLEPHQRNR